jgi:hypothetical protein
MIERIELEPTVIAEDCGVKIVGYTPRLYKLTHGDIFTVNRVAVKETFGMPIRRIKLGEIMNEHFICVEKIKRKHWWQFWKPKYVFAKFMYVEKDDTK